jgi:hypothetical protein
MIISILCKKSTDWWTTVILHVYVFLKMTALNKHDVQCIHTYLCFIIWLNIRFIGFINNSWWFFRNFNYFIITTRIVFCILSNINFNLKWEFAGIGRNRIKRARKESDKTCVHGAFLFLREQSENISFSVKHKTRFIVGFPLTIMFRRPLLSHQTVNQSYSTILARCHLLIISESQHVQETRQKKTC